MKEIKTFVFLLILWLAHFSTTADTIAFFYALDKDFDAFKSQAQPVGQSLKVGSRTIPVFLLNSHRVYVIKMKAGAVETAASAQALLARVHCDAAFSVGPIGDLSDKLEVGTWRQVGEIIGYQKGSWTQAGFQISTDADWKLTNAPPKCLPALFEKSGSIKIASGEIFVASNDYREQLRAITGADAVDMNLFGLATVCEDYKLPLFCWRIVSDHANNNANDDFKKFVANYNGVGGRAIAEIISQLPANLNSPESYPNLRKILSEPEK